MRINLNVVVDLGVFGSEREQILDTVTLARAVNDALRWHGTVELFDVYDHLTGSLLLDRDRLLQPMAQRALDGVEWGGR